ncbi:MAG: tol-pal system protein YbgF [Alphaproteobacteria bacterium]|nr:tol-pal system protein YbgF [Alphaproteobacteria bacterium]
MTKRTFLLATSALVLSFLVSSPHHASAQEGAYNAASTNMEMRLSAVEDQLRALTGKVEQMDFVTRRLDQALQRMQSDYDNRLLKLETAPVPTAPLPQPSTSAESPSHEESEAPTQPQQPVTGTLGGVKVRGDKITGGIINPKAPPLPNKPDDYGLTPQEAYERAFSLLRQANYDEAEKAFKGFIDKNPKDKLIDNAKYWYAETFYVRAKFGDAAIGFADALQQNPKGNKAPDSLLKLGMSLGAMDKTQDACDALAALKSKYPSAPTTIRSRADQERARMKCK